MPKYQVSIQFEMDEAFMLDVPKHRSYINELINKNIIDFYTVSMESMRSWIVINASNKKNVKEILSKSPLHKYWNYEIDELFIYDSNNYRLPEMNFN